MAYCTVTHWDTTEWTDEMESIAREKYVPLVMSVGADSVQMARTGDRSFMVVTHYPDSAAAESAQARIAEIRSQATEELPMKMASSFSGEVFAGS